MKENARNVALEALLQVEENQGYSNIVLDKALRAHPLDKRDSALASHIFYGVLEKRITLDYYIGKFLNKPVFVLNSAVSEILRIGAYQCLYLDKIPDSAIVNEAVLSVKELKKENQAGFVNGVLRELIRNKDKLTLPPDNLSVKYSVPKELAELFTKSYGLENTVKLLESFSTKAKTYIRRNPLRCEEIEGVVSYPWLKNAFEYTTGGDITKAAGFAEGYFHVQDLASQYLCKILSPKPGEIIIDTCAAPGGKTFTVAQELENTGKVYSYDIYKGRVGLIRSGAYRLGLTNVMASIRDARSEKCEISNADRILCDVPCSGFGTIRRKPEIRYKPLNQVQDLPEIQYDILQKSSKHLKSGGILLYSTCTLNPAENGEIADRFLRENKDFKPESIDIPKGLERIISEPKNQLTMFPFAGDTDGFFVSVFKKL